MLYAQAQAIIRLIPKAEPHFCRADLKQALLPKSDEIKLIMSIYTM
ncbi:hypothetical protein ALP79_200059 [Pseudomonas savastanoi pv. fraxini]|uniref:Uncharacterized protein n=1 Tax=Pseudomonas cerasi TaxID=1583341 RepID=A0A2K4W2V6_9PSED|nr:hypothetical protein ALP79_200059 [Pseudomonas savastanoi pv. fraxini]SOS30214.1 hypothetical protein PL963_P200091 [Pseudomonas cerasi]